MRTEENGIRLKPAKDSVLARKSDLLRKSRVRARRRAEGGNVAQVSLGQAKGEGEGGGEGDIR